MEVCFENIGATVNLLQELGFTIHPEKSVLLPTQKYLYFFLGGGGGGCFKLYHNDHTADRRKKTQIYSHCEMLFTENISIGELAQIIGVIVSPFMAVRHG